MFPSVRSSAPVYPTVRHLDDKKNSQSDGTHNIDVCDGAQDRQYAENSLLITDDKKNTCEYSDFMFTHREDHAPLAQYEYDQRRERSQQLAAKFAICLASVSGDTYSSPDKTIQAFLGDLDKRLLHKKICDLTGQPTVTVNIIAEYLGPDFTLMEIASKKSQIPLVFNPTSRLHKFLGSLEPETVDQLDGLTYRLAKAMPSLLCIDILATCLSLTTTAGESSDIVHQGNIAATTFGVIGLAICPAFCLLDSFTKMAQQVKAHKDLELCLMNIEEHFQSSDQTSASASTSMTPALAPLTPVVEKAD